MTKTTYEEMRAVSKEALLDPQPGDYWSDHFYPVLIILAVDGDLIRVCQKRVSTDADHWTFDIKEQTVFTRDELRTYLSYSTTALPDTPWAECGRYREGSKMYAFVEEANALSSEDVTFIRFVPKRITDKGMKEYSSQLTTTVGSLSAEVKQLLDSQDSSFASMLSADRIELTSLLKKVLSFLDSKEAGPKIISADIREIHLSPKTDKELGAYQCYTETLKTAQLLGPLDSNKEQQLHAITAGYIATLKKLRESEDKIKPT